MPRKVRKSGLIIVGGHEYSGHRFIADHIARETGRTALSPRTDSPDELPELEKPNSVLAVSRDTLLHPGIREKLEEAGGAFIYVRQIPQLPTTGLLVDGATMRAYLAELGADRTASTRSDLTVTVGGHQSLEDIEDWVRGTMVDEVAWLPSQRSCASGQVE